VLEQYPSPNPKLPWTSLALLLLADATLGWSLYGLTRDRSSWLFVAILLTILGAVVTYPSKSISMGFGGFFKTDTRAFILIVGSSIISVLLLTSLQLFIDTVLLTTAGLLVSLDLKTGGWSKRFSLFLIVGWQLIGLSAGLACRHIVLHPIADLPEFVYTDYWLQLLDRLN
jgi:hypothetical protein